jgi:hypothetical protein
MVLNGRVFDGWMASDQNAESNRHRSAAVAPPVCTMTVFGKPVGEPVDCGLHAVLRVPQSLDDGVESSKSVGESTSRGPQKPVGPCPPQRHRPNPSCRVKDGRASQAAAKPTAGARVRDPGRPGLRLLGIDKARRVLGFEPTHSWREHARSSGTIDGLALPDLR